MGGAEGEERFPISGDKTNFRYIDYRSCIFQLLFRGDTRHQLFRAVLSLFFVWPKVSPGDMARKLAAKKRGGRSHIRAQLTSVFYTQGA